MQNSEDLNISVRVKREKSTYFFACQLFQNIQMLKKRIQLFHRGVELTDMRMYFAGKLLDDKSNIHDQGITSDSIIHYRLKKGNTGEWEEKPQNS